VVRTPILRFANTRRFGFRANRGHYSAEGKLLTPLTKKQVKAVEKTLRGKVQKQTLPLNLQVSHTTRDSHFSHRIYGY
jgi:hypothetical protein